MKFITTGLGFYLGNKYDPILKKNTHIFTDKLREARAFTSLKSMENVMNILKEKGIDSFNFSPNKEEPIRDKYEVLPPRQKTGEILCTAHTLEEDGDTYLNDEIHYYLSVLTGAIVASENHSDDNLWFWNIKECEKEHHEIINRYKNISK